MLFHYATLSTQLVTQVLLQIALGPNKLYISTIPVDTPISHIINHNVNCHTHCNTFFSSLSFG